MAPVTRIGLIGCGRWGRHVLRDLLALDAAVHVVASGEHARAAAAAGAQTVASVQELPEVDGIVVVTPTSTHADVVEAVLPRGVPVFCEKPLCDDAARARHLAQIGRDRVFVMDKWRYHRGVLELAGIARSGELGPVVGLRTSRLGYGHAYSDTDCVWTLLPHELSIGMEILGGLLPPRHAVADRADGIVMGLVASCANDDGPWHVMEVGMRSLQQRTVTLLCGDGTATLADAYADHILIVNNPGACAPEAHGGSTDPQITQRPIPVEMPLLAELACFLAHVRGGPPPKSSVAEAAQSVETISAIRRLAAI